MATVNVRYIVNDLDEAIAFYCGHLGFTEKMHPAPMFAMIERGDLCLLRPRLCPTAQAGGTSHAGWHVAGAGRVEPDIA